MESSLTHKRAAELAKAALVKRQTNIVSPLAGRSVGRTRHKIGAAPEFLTSSKELCMVGGKTLIWDDIRLICIMCNQQKLELDL